MIVIANSTIFIGLAKIGKLHLLQKIFSKDKALVNLLLSNLEKGEAEVLALAKNLILEERI